MRLEEAAAHMSPTGHPDDFGVRPGVSLVGFIDVGLEDAIIILSKKMIDLAVLVGGPHSKKTSLLGRPITQRNPWKGLPRF